jgi:hypothetical protein
MVVDYGDVLVALKPPDIATVSVPDALAKLHVDPETGLTQAEVNVRREENGYNEVAEKKGHPLRRRARVSRAEVAAFVQRTIDKNWRRAFHDRQDLRFCQPRKKDS